MCVGVVRHAPLEDEVMIDEDMNIQHELTTMRRPSPRHAPYQANHSPRIREAKGIFEKNIRGLHPMIVKNTMGCIALRNYSLELT